MEVVQISQLSNEPSHGGATFGRMPHFDPHGQVVKHLCDYVLDLFARLPGEVHLDCSIVLAARCGAVIALGAAFVVGASDVGCVESAAERPGLARPEKAAKLVADWLYLRGALIGNVFL